MLDMLFTAVWLASTIVVKLTVYTPAAKLRFVMFSFMLSVPLATMAPFASMIW